jgi:diguanylate cyclase (GGDEF)-like protein
MSTLSAQVPVWRLRAPVLRITWLSWTIAFAIGLSAAVVGIETWQILLIRDATLRNASDVAATLAQTIAIQIDNTFKTADTVVGAIVERIEIDGKAPAAQSRLYGLMTSLSKALPAIHEIGIIDRDGSAIVKSRVRAPDELDYRDLDYFRHFSAQASRELFIGKPVPSRLDGESIVTVSRRLDVGGTFDGVVVAGVSMDYFRSLFESVDLPGFIALVNDDGTLLAGNDSGFGVGDLAGLIRAGSTVEYRARDGTQRVGAYRTLSRFPMTVVVAQNSDAVLAGWRAQARNHAILVASGLVALAFLGWRLECATRHTRRQALVDMLTELPNRRFLNEAIEGEFRRAARRGEPLSFVMADIDLFKSYNDTHGHQAGDDCLKAVAVAIAGALGRASDLAARYGGEEIAILLPETDLAGAAEVAERLQTAVSALRIRHDGSPYGIVTISAGVASCIPNPVTSWTPLVHAADEALYAAKASGRNTVRVHDG